MDDEVGEGRVRVPPGEDNMITWHPLYVPASELFSGLVGLQAQLEDVLKHLEDAPLDVTLELLDAIEVVGTLRQRCTAP